MTAASLPACARIEIVDAGASTTVQDGGRLGSVHYGVSPSGAVDRRALETANRRLGNDPHAPVLESLLGGLSFRVSADRWCAVSGARAAVLIDGARVTEPERFLAPSGSRIDICEASRGLYTVLAVSGGIDAARTLGSASTDTLSGIGPSRLTAGDAFELGDARDPADSVHPDVSLPSARAEIAFRWGPRDAQFDVADRELLLRTEWIVSNDTNRVGARLDGARLRGGDGTLPSEGIMTGSIQIPPSGQPIVFLADRPVTGGYPVIGVVDEHDLGRFAQVRPGARVRFRPHP
ncbi:biotin-dependent carboxyltransferase family protein [Leucobacter japonicus]|uniref:5-oxoprolinase subunit C family protein n=1 Tax=Leucobacter japonicus TaxID=1461259 RepID=UPI0006A7B294|nr:biotin-dependent carboxyltransferase family protein [Leucobacter japonicus]